MKWNSNERKKQLNHNGLPVKGCYCQGMREKGFGADFVCGHCTGEDASLEAMERGISRAERSYTE